MGSERWARLRALFAQATACNAEDLSGLLAQVELEDPGLREELEAMLAQVDVPFELPASPDTPPFEMVGDFMLLQRLGRGGSGDVYLARQQSLNRLVAVKLLAAANDRTHQRFEKEGPTLARLNHEGIVRVHAVGNHKGVAYIAMDYVAGTSLAEELENEADGEESFLTTGRERYFQIARFTERLARALDHAHSIGLVHRDVKPDNIIVTPDGEPRLIDFGLAKDMLEVDANKSLGAAGTLPYMSFEQIQARSLVDRRSDVYGLGVVLYEMLARQRPFDAPTEPEIIREITRGTPAPLAQAAPDVPRDLATICHKAIELYREDRFQSAAEFADDLGRFLDHRAITAKPTSLTRRSWKWVLRNVALVAAAALVIVAIAGTYIVTQVSDRNAALSELREQLTAVRSGAATMSHAAIQQRGVQLDQEFGLPGELKREFQAFEKQYAEDCDARDRAAILALQAGVGDPPRESLDEFVPDSGSRLREGFAAITDAILFRGNASAIVTNGMTNTLSVPVTCTASLPRPEQDFRILVQSVDPITGRSGPARQVLEAAPGDTVQTFTLSPGPVRIWCIQDGVGFSESFCWLRAGQPTELNVRIVPSAEADVGMVRVDGGTVTRAFPLAGARVPKSRATITYDVRPFLVDRTPVTFGAYRAYLAATNQAIPTWWPETPDPEFETRPVVSITIDEARAYAEWAGKRLLTLSEFDLLTQGESGRKFPWGDEAGELLARCVLDRPRFEAVSGEDPADADRRRREWCLSSLPPVGTTPAECQVNGVCDLIGTVWEFVETWNFGFEGPDQVHVPRDKNRFTVGESSTSRVADVARAGFHGFVREVPALPSLETGFRCARSVEPPNR